MSTDDKPHAISAEVDNDDTFVTSTLPQYSSTNARQRYAAPATSSTSDGHQQSTKTKVLNGALTVGKKVVDYDGLEYHRLGVQAVSVTDWFRDVFAHPGTQAAHYLDSLFPIRHWLGSYNLTWFTGDMIAGITVCLVLVPQSMSYASVAGLESQFGLYTSFIGVMIYALFATSKDVTIGPVAVMSLETHSVIQHVLSQTNQWRPEEIASALAFVCGIITFGLGILRLGWIIEFIPAPAVSGFMTGSALTIAIGQVPKLMGIKSVHTNQLACYQIVIQTLKHLGETGLDAAFGLPALATLYFIRWFCKWLPRRYPRTARVAFFITILRNAFVIIVLLVAARIWLGNNHQKTKPISLLGHVPRGFKDISQPNLDPKLISHLGSKLPVSVIVLLLEHISIAKSFGRLNDYRVEPSQELIAIGVTNFIGPCFHAYAATGSFSRSAIKSKSGVRTPVAGWITGIGVLIAIYALTGVMQWIPNAALAAVIIHAVGDLIASPATLYRYWLMSPLELVIWFASVMVTVFTSVDNGVYTAVAASAALLLIRIARPRGRWLGMVRVSHHGDQNSAFTQSRSTLGSGAKSFRSFRSRRSGTGLTGVAGAEDRVVFVPLDSKNGLRDPSVKVEPPPAGVLVYRFEEAYLYPNASHLADILIERAKTHTRPGKPLNYGAKGDRPWNNPGPMHPWLRRIVGRVTGKSKEEISALIAHENDRELHDDPRPTLRAFVFDFSCVGNVDTTSIQALVDVRRSLEKYADAPIEFHFANLLSPWIRRALLAGGFGTGTATKHVVEIAPVVPSSSPISVTEERQRAAEEDSRRKRGIARIMALRDRALRRKQPSSRLPTTTTFNAATTYTGTTPELYGDADADAYSDEYNKSSAAARKQDDLESSPSTASRQQQHHHPYNSQEGGEDTIQVAPATADLSAAQAHTAQVAEDTEEWDDEVQVPIVWDNDLTPLFHLDLASAVEAATAAVPDLNDEEQGTQEYDVRGEGSGIHDAPADLVYPLGEAVEDSQNPTATLERYEHRQFDQELDHAAQPGEHRSSTPGNGAGEKA